MAVKKGVILAGVIGTAGAPVAGYFIYDRLKDGDAPPATAATKPAILEPKTEGRSFYGTYANFQAGDCAKTFFDKVEFKFQGGGSSTEAFDLNWAGTGEVKACLIIHAKHKGEKGAFAASTELAVTQGTKGLVMWTVIPGKPARGNNLREEIRVVLLENTGGTWAPKKGFSWFTKAGAGSNSLRGIKIKVTGTNEEKTLDNSDGKLWGSDSGSTTTAETDYKKRWTFSNSPQGGTETLFGKLEITDKDNNASGLWGTKDHKLTKGPYFYGAMDTEWKWTSNFSNSLSKDVEIPFKDIKGKWEAVT